MILTPEIIADMRRYQRIDICLEQMLLKQLGTEPYPHVYTEQDIHEQSRKMIIRYNEGLAPTTAGIVSDTTTLSKTRRDQEAISDEIL